MTATQKAVLLHPMGSMGEAIADECQALGAWGRSLIDTLEYRAGQAEMNLRARNLLVYGTSHPEALLPSQEEADRAEIERINLSGARYRESVRLEKLGELPWDFSQGEAS